MNCMTKSNLSVVQECIQAAVMEERRSQEAVKKEAVQQIREDMERYLQEQRQVGALLLDLDSYE